MEKKIGIIGLGMVGGVLEKYFSPLGYKIYRKDLNIDEDVNQADIVFISVPTPFNQELNGYDLSAIRSNLSLIKPGKIVVLKSTIQPGTTESLQLEFSDLKILFSPEFLTEATTEIDFNQPDRQIIGTTDESSDVADLVMSILPKANISLVMSATEAELVKLSSNAFMSMKVVFYNQIYDFATKLNLNYENIAKGVSSDRRIGNSHTKIWFNDKRGYRGKCLPKDMKALISAIKKSGLTPELFAKLEEINEELLKM